MQTYSLVDCKKYPLDWKINELFNKDNGFYIELGANDGINQSNTAFLNFNRNWKGILIEPSVTNYKKCIENRKGDIILNCACVSDSYTEKYIEGDFEYGNLMASVNGSRIKKEGNMVKVTATTLEKILDEHLPKDTQIDFLSLDVEGYELEVLKGINFKKYKPLYMLIEIYNKDYQEIVSFLTEKGYSLESNFTNYNHVDNPIWDGTHNDYLFKLI